jgi:hypothetical protein
VATAVKIEDAFDAAVSAPVMDAHRDRLTMLDEDLESDYRLEGIIWHPAA